MDRRKLLGVFAGLAAVAPMLRQQAKAAEPPKGGVHRLAIHVDSNDPAVMGLALGNTKNAADYYAERGEKFEVEIVAYGPGLTMLRDDTSPVKDRIATLKKSIPTLAMSACGNTMAGIERSEGKPPPLLAGAVKVPAGVVRLMQLQEEGWSYLRP